tara:strand:+ start:580 stop:2199 length:1620 start_codon:yes stop_codon:yes gene_type:complete
VAVVQISRIQVRRGQKNQGSGVPQLSGGEFGWAVDSRELYIGNGSVAEGAPAVGNTKIITEHDDLFTLANTYTYLGGQTVQTGVTSTAPVKRTLQDRLDELVSVKAFGAKGDGTDQTVAIQRAIDQLYINSSTKGTEQSRAQLYFPAGVYKITSTIFVPPFASIVGAGKDKTKFDVTNNVIVFQTVNESSTPGTPADDSSSTTLNQARQIVMKDFTVATTQTTQPVFKLQSCKMSNFENIRITGPWTTGTTITRANAGIELGSLSSVVCTQENKFDHITVDGMSVGIVSDDDVYNNHFHCCYFKNLGHGIQFGQNSVLGSQGQVTGPCKNKIGFSEFKNIDKEGLAIANGNNNFSTTNNYEGVGNVGGTEGNAQYSIIDFAVPGNSSIEDSFTRTADLSYGQSFIVNKPYISEIKGYVHAQLGGMHSLEVSETSSYTYFFRLPGDYSRTYEVDYFYNSSLVNAQRSGKMIFQLDQSTSTVNFIDDYDYQGDSNYETALKFQASLVNTDGISSVDTIVVSVLNSVVNDAGRFTFKIKVIG